MVTKRNTLGTGKRFWWSKSTKNWCAAGYCQSTRQKGSDHRLWAISRIREGDCDGGKRGWERTGSCVTTRQSTTFRELDVQSSYYLLQYSSKITPQYTRKWEGKKQLGTAYSFSMSQLQRIHAVLRRTRTCSAWIHEALGPTNKWGVGIYSHVALHLITSMNGQDVCSYPIGKSEESNWRDSGYSVLNIFF